MTDTQPTDLDLARRDLLQVKAALNDPKIGLFASRKLYRRLESLYRELERLEMEIPEHEPSH